MQQENKLQRKYTLTVFKDGLYQEVSPEEFQELKELCPLIGEIFNDHSLIEQVPDPVLTDPMTPLYDSWEKAAKRLIASLWRCPSA